MIELTNTEVCGWEPAIRGMRNPMNSWDRTDSGIQEIYGIGYEFVIGPKDADLMRRLCTGGPVHAKFRRMITVYVDIDAPLYWWKEFDTYKVGTVANSCSTMHKIHTRDLTLEDFSWEHLGNRAFATLERVVDDINYYREQFIETKDKKYWWQIIQLLPTSYNQKRTVELNYEVLHNIYDSRLNHKLDEWRDMCGWIESLPYSWIITGKEN